MNECIPVVRTGQLKDANAAKTWIWDGLAGPGDLTLFTSVCKLGKTTLLAHLLAQRQQAGPFLGRAVRPGPSVIISEEPATLWDARHEQLGFRADDNFICRPFAIAPSTYEWERLIAQVLALKEKEGVDLVVIDTLAYFLPPGAENAPSILIKSLMPIHQLTKAGMAVVLVHHPRKAASQAGLASRGSSMLPGFADIILEMYPRTRDEISDRGRRLLSFSRFAATPRVLLFELSADGREFVVNEEPPPFDEFTKNWGVLRLVLEDADHELTRQQIMEQWPSTYLKPKQSTLWSWLDAAFERGLVRIEGNGRRSDPYRYYLPEKLEEWKKDPMYQLNQTMAESVKAFHKQFGRMSA